MMKVALVTCNNLANFLSVHSFLRDFGASVEVIVVTTFTKAQKRPLAGGLERLRSSGYRFTLFKAIINVFLPSLLNRRGYATSATEYCERYGHRPNVLKVSRADHPGVVNTLEETGIEVLVSAGASHIFKDNLLKVPKNLAINLHPSLLPEYSGLDPAFWSLLNQEPEAGSTLHLMEPEVDAGPIISQLSFPMGGLRSVLHVLMSSCLASDQILHRFFKSGLKLNHPTPQDQSKRTHYRVPLRSDVRSLYRNGNHLFSAKDLAALSTRVRSANDWQR